MSLVAKRCRHFAVAIPVVAIGGLVAVSAGQQRPLSHTSTDALSRASTEELLLELRRRIIALHNRSSESWDDWGGGLDPHGDWPEQG
jgi:hypothetical protein